MRPLKKTANGLGLAFSGDDEWRGFYSMMIAMGAAQNLYSLARWNNYRPKYLVRWRGANAISNWDGTNRLMAVRIADQIRAYCNGKLLPGGEESDPYYGPNRLVGLIVTSFEFSEGEIEFDNFKLTPLYPDDFDDYLGSGEEVESHGFDTSPLPPP